MKDNKVERVRQEVAMFRRQFLQDDTDAFDQALGNQEITAVVSELVAPHRERIYPPWDTLHRAKAALLADVLPRVLSFTGAKRLLCAFVDQLRRTSGK